MKTNKQLSNYLQKFSISPPGHSCGNGLLFCKIPLKSGESYGMIITCEIMVHALHG